MSLVQGIDANEVVRPLLLDSSGRVIVVGSGSNGEVEVIQQTPADMRVGSNGWIGAAWQKNPLQLGFTATYLETSSTTSAGAGTNTMAGSVVPAGEIWVVTAMSAINFNTVNTTTYLQQHDGSTGHNLKGVKPPAAGKAVAWQGMIILEAGWKVQAIYTGCVSGDDLFFTASGWKIDIDQ